MKYPRCISLALVSLVALIAVAPATAEESVARKRPVSAYPALRTHLAPGAHTLNFRCTTESREDSGVAVVAGSFEPLGRSESMRWISEYSWDRSGALRGRLPGSSSSIELNASWADNSLLLNQSGSISVTSEEGGVLRWFCAQSGQVVWLTETFDIDGLQVEVDYQSLDSFRAFRATDFKGASLEFEKSVGVVGRHTEELQGYAFGRFGESSGVWEIRTPYDRRRTAGETMYFAEHSPGIWTFAYRGTVGDAGHILWLAELRFLVCSDAEDANGPGRWAVTPVACRYVA